MIKKFEEFINEHYEVDKYDKKYIANLLEKILNDRQRKIVSLYLGLDYIHYDSEIYKSGRKYIETKETFTFKEISEMYNLVVERVKQIYKDSIEKIKKWIKSHPKDRDVLFDIFNDIINNSPSIDGINDLDDYTIDGVDRIEKIHKNYEYIDAANKLSKAERKKKEKEIQYNHCMNLLHAIYDNENNK